MKTIWNDLTDTFTQEFAIDEMAKKYGNTFLVLKPQHTKEPIIAKYKGFNNGTHNFVDELESVIKLNHETETEVICVFPERCLFNIENMALEFIRKPLRQYRRGICSDNVYIYSPVRALWESTGYSWTASTLKHALFPTYPKDCPTALNQLSTPTQLSIALNPKFMLSKSLTKDPIYHLFYCNVVIGYYEKSIFFIKHPDFKQEVLDNINIFSPYEVQYG